MEDINKLVARAKKAEADLEDSLAGAEREIEYMEKHVEDSNREFCEVYDGMKGNLAYADGELKRLSYEVQRGIIETKNIGDNLERLFGRSYVPRNLRILR